MMVIAGFSSIVGPEEPLPGPLRRETHCRQAESATFAGVYAKQGLERQDIVRFLPCFHPKDEDGDSPAGAIVALDRLK
ncbi:MULTISPECIES: hypothetical protein [unclassified Mesorhizobium]|uniref:hypothetical protein n=1 Tax=unclassified Mesorhizobium TaxID=325217 RepID=UPI000FCB8942|nr:MULTISPECIES: hypothetical protein [unclassified Mesorhizobium]RUW31415.1 hypothetical protein EOA38_17945 [Mesorhizobium sp. M1E.F.Ca.ET.041.01.1.1]RWB53493.1 MAG: hypothetical protein EOQ47_21485 [Mesorhizobium sp.]RWD92775.1 MAG: hypothetical protein EOS38_02800 [Mesorhizobium sp.]